MTVNWTEVNERRIGEKQQEILLYCAQKKQVMTPRAFDLARISVDRLLDNISDRTPKADFAIRAVRESMIAQDVYIAECNEKQALAIARGIVYMCIGDDIGLYPITAEKKLSLSKARNQMECRIPIEEMTTRDKIYVASAIAKGENIARSTMIAIYEWFRGIGLEPMEALFYSVLFMEVKPVPMKLMPQRLLLSSKFSTVVKALVDKGFIREYSEKTYCVAKTIIA